MTVRRLDNAAWGFASSCFVCEPSNPSGLGIAFFHDDEAGLVYADYTLGPAFSGSPRLVHGGVTMAVLDEAMAWATITLAHTFALTRRSTTEFHRPVLVGRPHRVEARLQSGSDTGPDALQTEAVVLDADGRRCARSRAEFRPVSAAQAAAVIGSVEGDDAGFVKG